MNMPQERAKLEGKLVVGCSDEERVLLAMYLLNLKKFIELKSAQQNQKQWGGRDKDGWQATYAENRGQDWLFTVSHYLFVDISLF